MKPLNLDNRPCSPLSSNCVVWQGPDIPCIKICNGDTVSDVVFALATELCTILDQTNVSNYDLTCLGITECGPKDFQALIQLLIDKICEAQGITNIPGKTLNGCPDCIVTVAPCFQVGNQVTMQLLDYVNMIASKVCALIDEIAVINTQITDILIRLDDLENAPVPDTEIPAFTLGCQIGSLGSGTVQFINVTLQEFINNVWCPFFAVLGSTQTLIDAVNAKCISDSDLQLSTVPRTPYDTNAQWIDDAQYNTIADAINNLWVVVCDIYNYLDAGLPVSVVEGGEGITVTSNVVGDITTYTVNNDYLETFQAVVTINNDWQPSSGIIPTKVPSAVTGVEDGQVIIRYTTVTSNSVTVVSDDTAGNYVSAGCMPPFSFGTFDNDTGVFTITDPGTYLIHAMIHLKSDSGSSVFWSGTSSGDIGSFVLGLHPNNAGDTYVAQGQALIPNIDKNVEISVSRIITAPPVAPNPTANTKVRVKVLNTTNRSYNGTTYDGSDAILFSIVKLRNGLTSTACYRPV